MRGPIGIGVLLVIASGCAPKSQPSDAPDIRLTSQGGTVSTAGGLLTLIDGKRVTTANTPKQNEIADIELIKAPASGDIFGSEAAGGLMRITTKSHELPKSAPGCEEKPGSNPYFEFQVQRPAVYLENEINFPHPTTANTGLLVQFVVDTTGRPDGRSFHVLRTPDEPAALAAAKAFQGWRFIPAFLNGCRVRQLFQTPVAR